jgi:hypothetical protein
MRLKKEYIILAVIIIGLSVYLYKRSSDRTLYKLPDIPKVAQKDITKLQITKGQTVIVLNRKDEKWYIAPQEYPTDSQKVKELLNAVENLRLTALVSESKNYNLYDLDEAQKINVKVWQGDNLKLDIDVGKTASSFRHTFVRPAGEERVFHAQGNLKNNFDVSVDNLRDKVVLTFKPTDIQQIQISKEQQSLTFNRTQVPVEVKAPGAAAEKKTEESAPAQKLVWQVADGQTVDEAALNQLLNTLANLRCEKFIDNRQKEDFSGPLFTLQLKGAVEHSLFIFPKTEEQDKNFPAVSSGSNYPFLLSGSQVERIMKDPSAFLKKPEAEAKKSE